MKQFDSNFKQVKFRKTTEVRYKKVYGYVPVVLLSAKRKSDGGIFPRFTIAQAYLDEYKQWHNYFDRFIIYSEDFKQGDIIFYYQVVDWKGKVTEKGKVI